MFFRRLTRPKRPVRMSNDLYSLSGLVNVTRQSLAYKYAARSMIFRPRSPMPASVGVTTVTQWQRTASMTKLKILEERGSLCVDP